jgi:5-methylcytosine-specific restriction endonuclease McrA
MKDEIIALLKKGRKYTEIVEEVGCSKSVIAYHANRIGLSKFRKGKYDWQVVQEYINEGHTVKTTIRYFGMSTRTWLKATRAGDVKPLGQQIIPIEELLSENSHHSRVHAKARLLKEGLLKALCYECGISDWRGKPLSLQIDHINGNSKDWRLENLRILCPNCHSQTETYCGKNIRKRRKK